MNIRLGRFISVPGIEAQLAPNNYIFSHSLLYAIDPFTDTGLIATVKLNDQWLVQLGITSGHDVAPWTPDAKPSGTACLSYTTISANEHLYVCANGINNGKYAHNNLQPYDATWYHKFSKTIHMATALLDVAFVAFAASAAVHRGVACCAQRDQEPSAGFLTL